MSVEASETIHPGNIQKMYETPYPAMTPPPSRQRGTRMPGRRPGREAPPVPAAGIFVLSGEITTFVSGQSYLYIRYKNKHLRPMDPRSRSTCSPSDIDSVFAGLSLRHGRNQLPRSLVSVAAMVLARRKRSDCGAERMAAFPSHQHCNPGYVTSRFPFPVFPPRGIPAATGAVSPVRVPHGTISPDVHI